MKLFIKLNNKKSLPTVDNLAKYMWEEGNSFSKAGDSTKLESITSLSLCWDKWLDDAKFENHPKFKEYIYFEKSRVRDQNYDIFLVEIDDDALFIDKRAFYRGALTIAQKSQGEVSSNKSNWLTINEFLKEYSNFIEVSFEDSVKESLNKD